MLYNLVHRDKAGHVIPYVIAAVNNHYITSFCFCIRTLLTADTDDSLQKASGLLE